jgi:YkoY family integral membrane protein
MLGQVFEFKDLSTVGVLLVLEALLSADNALILALIVRHLPRDQQRKALMYGLLGAFALRLLAIVLASSIISFWWLQFVGALYLLYLPIKHFIKQASQVELRGYSGAGFWMTVVYADLADLAFAIDSVLVAVAIEPHRNKIWVVYLGAVLGIILLRWAAGACLTLLERYPVFDHLAYVLVGWAGIKLLFLSGHTFERWYVDKFPGTQFPVLIPEMHPAIFWTGMALIAGIGSWLALRKPAPPPTSGHAPTPDERAGDDATKPASQRSE